MWLFAIPLVKLSLGWAFSLFGFGPLGPIAGTVATAWQATYMGFVPAGGLFAFLQSLGMTLF